MRDRYFEGRLLPPCWCCVSDMPGPGGGGTSKRGGGLVPPSKSVKYSRKSRQNHSPSRSPPPRQISVKLTSSMPTSFAPSALLRGAALSLARCSMAEAQTRGFHSRRGDFAHVGVSGLSDRLILNLRPARHTSMRAMEPGQANVGLLVGACSRWREP